MIDEQWIPIPHKVNFRVEADYDSYPIRPSLRTESDANSLADAISQLRGIKGYVSWDIEYECPNCRLRDSSKEALKGCCEASEEQEVADA